MVLVCFNPPKRQVVQAHSHQRVQRLKRVMVKANTIVNFMVTIVPMILIIVKPSLT